VSFGGEFFEVFYLTIGLCHRRYIMENGTCALCEAESESVMYALIVCIHAKLFREAAKEILLGKLPKLHPLT
jgi:hypothetical protein